MDVGDTAPLIVPVPFEASEPDSTQTFTGQYETTGLILNQWDAQSQTWRSATYTPGIGWTGDVITLTPASPLSLQLPTGQADIRLSFGGLLPVNPLTQTLFPGLNHVGSPQFAAKPLTSWNWDQLGVAGSTLSGSDVLHDPANQPQAWLQDDQGTITWTGVTNPAQPGVLDATAAYFYEHKGAQSIQVQGTVVPNFNAQALPAISAVGYNAAQNQTAVTVSTPPGASHTLDLYYLDLTFPAGYDPTTIWSVWTLGEVTGAGESHIFIDSGDSNRVNPTTVDARLYQVGDATLDADNDGLSDSFETLVSKTNLTNADTDGDGVPDGAEVNTGLNPNTADGAVSSTGLLVDIPFDTDSADQSGLLTTTLENGATVLAGAGISGGALEVKGQGQRLNLGSAATFNTQGPYTTRTFSLWFAVDAHTSGKQMLFESGGSARGFNAYLENGTLYAGAWDDQQDSAAGDQDIWNGNWATSQDVQPGTWHHLVLVLGASTQPTQLQPGVLRVYLDGAEIGSLNGMQVYSHGDEAGLGGVNGATWLHDESTTTGPYDLAGAIDNFQVWDRALSAGEAAILFYQTLQANPNRTWQGSPLAEILFEQNLNDEQGVLTLTASGSPAYTSPGIHTTSLRLQEGQSVEIQPDDLYNAAGPYLTRTLSVWFTTDHMDFGRQMIYETGGSTRGMNLYIENGILYAGAWDSEKDDEAGDIDTWAGSWQTTNRIQANTWHHAVLVLNATQDPTRLTSGVFQAYLDGLPFENGSTSGMQLYTHGDPGGVGQNLGSTLFHDAAPTDLSTPLYGAVDSLLLWNRSLSPAEITGLYTAGSANGTTTGWNVESFYTVTGGLDGDPDGDGLSNAFEIGHGSDPDTFTRTLENADALYEHLWFGLPTGNPTTVVTWPQYPYQPDQETLYSAVGDLFKTPTNIGSNFGRRMFGQFVAPLTGDYVFFISSDDGSELWLTLNGVRTKVLESVYKQTTQSAPVSLVAGESYPLEAIMIENGGSDYLKVGVKLPDNRYEIPMRARRFITPAPGTDFSLDTDADGLSDYEETVVGTDANNPDTSGDGVSDYDAVTLNLDPTVAQPILPAISGLWVRQYNIPTHVAYIHEDLDGDHLTNFQEYLHGSNPWLADTSGDGWTDDLVVDILGLDPSIAWFNGTQSTAVQVNGSAATETEGWTVTSQNTLKSDTRSGHTTYEIDVPQAGIYGVVFSLGQHNSFGGTGTFGLQLTVDGKPAGTRTAKIANGATEDVLFLTPTLDAGIHSFSLRIENLHSGDLLEIHHVDLVTLGGLDVDQNGIADWISQRELGALSHQTPLTSSVSPVFIEGESPYFSHIDIVSSVDPQEILSARRGPRATWYANAELLVTGPTEIVVSEHYIGAVQTNVVTWTETNALQPPVEPIQLRVGDSLLLTAYPVSETQGSITFDIEGQIYSTTVGTPLAYQFESQGMIPVLATWSHAGQSQQTTLTVEVIGGQFSSTPSIVMQKSKIWENPQLPDSLVLDADPNIRFYTVPPATTGQALKLFISDSEPHTIAARLGENGPIVDSKTLIALNSQIATNFKVLQTYADGSRLLGMELAISDVTDDLEITLDLATSGLLFENGEGIITYTGADVDSDGVLRYQLLQAPTNYTRVCHYIFYSYSE
jgi:hypothetical protein